MASLEHILIYLSVIHVNVNMFFLYIQSTLLILTFEIQLYVIKVNALNAS